MKPKGYAFLCVLVFASLILTACGGGGGRAASAGRFGRIAIRHRPAVGPARPQRAAITSTSIRNGGTSPATATVARVGGSVGKTSRKTSL